MARSSLLFIPGSLTSAALASLPLPRLEEMSKLRMELKGLRMIRRPTEEEVDVVVDVEEEAETEVREETTPKLNLITAE